MPEVTKEMKQKGPKGKAEWMSKCISTLQKEGKPRDQQIAQCLNMWKQGVKRKKSQGSNEPPDFDKDNDLGIAIFLP